MANGSRIRKRNENKNLLTNINNNMNNKDIQDTSASLSDCIQDPFTSEKVAGKQEEIKNVCIACEG